MPQLRTLSTKTERVYLPSTDKPGVAEEDKAWVDLKTDYTLRDLSYISSNSGDIILAGITCMIAGWNMTDANGQTEPIGMDTVALLDPEDFPLLSEKFAKLYSDDRGEVTSTEKKTLDGTSGESQVTTETPQPTT